VLQEGDVAPGDVVERLETDPNQVSVTAVCELYLARETAPDALRRVLQVAALPEAWRHDFEARLA
jgi:MOSC domain-containing protein YiiM